MVLATIFYWYYDFLASHLHRLWPRYFYGKAGVYFLPGLVLKVLATSHASAEAEAFRYVRQHTTIPVPKVYAAAEGRGYRFFLMEKVEGQCAAYIWKGLNVQQRDVITDQLRDYITQLRTLPSPYGKRICDASGGPVLDFRITCSGRVGPWDNETSFVDFTTEFAKSFVHPDIVTSARAQMRDNHRIYFTHGDLAPRNIMVKDGKITGLVDWGNAGWFPEHWELVKAMWCPSLDEDWNRRIQGIFGEEDVKDWTIDKAIADELTGAF